MADWVSIAAQWVWQGALMATVPALCIGLWLRLVPARPATRHTLWLIVLAWFVVAPFVPAAPADWRLGRGLARLWQTGDSALRDLTAANASPAGAAPSSQCDPPDAFASIATVPTPPRTGARSDAGAAPTLALDTARFQQCQGLAQAEARRDHDVLRSLPSLQSAMGFYFDADAAMSRDGGEGAHTVEHHAAHDRSLALPARIGACDDVTPAPNTADSENAREESTLARFGTWLAATWERTTDLWTRHAPITIWAWLVGAVGIAVARAGASWVFMRRLQMRPNCPRAVLDAVAQAARHVGLTRPPPVHLVADAISPMISLFGGTRLLLPEQLWSRLDEGSRRTILYHELAHLARRDHWVRLCAFLIGAMYWWHPVVWWVRRQLDEEAEHCCDAWVTWLLPAGRRTYARALLTTSEFISTGGMPTPALGIGVSPPRRMRARRIARRLTMVMTQSSRPKMSLSGVALVSAMMLLGWLVTPAWCKPTSHQPAPPTPPAQPTPAVAPIPPTPDIPPQPPIAADLTPRPPGLIEAGATFVNGLLALNTDDDPEMQGEQDGDDNDNDDADDDLEARLDRLERRLEELTASPHRSPRAVVAAPGAAQEGEKFAREYHLPKGKLEALIGLMSRQDVPILVQGGDDLIIVNATPAQHEVFAAFVRMIDPRDGDTTPSPHARTAPTARGIGRSVAPSVVRVAPVPGLQSMIRGRVDGAIRHEMETLQRQKQELEEAAARLRDKAAELSDKAKSVVDGQIKQELRKEADALRRKAQDIARQAKELARAHRQQERDVRNLERELKQKKSDAGKADEGDDDDDAEAPSAADAYGQGYQLHMKGEYDRAIELFKKAAAQGQSKGASLYNIACGYARKGNKDLAFEYLAKAWAAGYQEADHMRQDDDLDSIRNDKRFGEIVGAAKDKDDDDGDQDE